MNKKIRGGVNIGTNSVLVAFVLLCLVTFAALTYLSANSDYKLSLEASKRTSEYYDANAKAELILADIDKLLNEHYDNCTSEENFLNSIDSSIDGIDSVSLIKVDENIYLAYSVPMNSTQELQVKLRVDYPSNPDSQIISIDQWNTANTGPLDARQ